MVDVAAHQSLCLQRPSVLSKLAAKPANCNSDEGQHRHPPLAIILVSSPVTHSHILILQHGKISYHIQHTQHTSRIAAAYAHTSSPTGQPRSPASHHETDKNHRAWRLVASGDLETTTRLDDADDQIQARRPPASSAYSAVTVISSLPVQTSSAKVLRHWPLAESLGCHLPPSSSSALVSISSMCQRSHDHGVNRVPRQPATVVEFATIYLHGALSVGWMAWMGSITLHYELGVGSMADGRLTAFDIR